MKMSESINELAGALAKAQGAFAVPKKGHRATVATKTGGSYTYAYSTLDELIDATRPALTANGIAVVFDVTAAEGFVSVSTLLTHSSGQWWASDPLVLPSGGTPQGAGSAATYGRRYSLSGALNIAAEEDDDAQQAQPAQAKPNGKPPVKLPAAKPAEGGSMAMISKDQQKRLFAIATKHAWKPAEIKALLKRVLNVESSSQISTYRYKEICQMLESGVDALANTQEPSA